MGCVIKNFFTLTSRIQNRFYRTMLRGIVCASLLLVIGCGGDPETESPDSSPNTDSSDNQGLDPVPEENTSQDATNPDPFADDPAKNTGDPSNNPDQGNEKNPFANGENQFNMAAFLQGKDRKRPKEVSEWEWTDFVPAIKAKDPWLLLAIQHFEKKYEGKPFIVECLMKLLDPNTLNPEVNTPDSENTSDNRRYNNRNNRNAQQVQLDQKMVERIIVALARNKTPEAAQALRKIVEDKDLNLFHPQAATKTALQVLAVMDVDHFKNDKVLFTALVDPLEYRDLKGNASSGGGTSYNRNSHNRNQRNIQRMSAETLAQEAEKLLKPIASENLRTLLGGHVLPNSSISGPDRETFLAWFEESLPENVMGQIRVYEENIPNAELLDKFEEYFALYSGTAIARLLGVIPRTPDLSMFSNSKSKRPSLQELRGWGGGSGNAKKGNELAIFIAECLDEKARKTSPEEELVRLTKKLWGREIASMVAKRLNERLIQPLMGEKGKKAIDEKNRITLACTMPLDKVRNALFKRCKNYYQQGPGVALGDLLTKNANKKSMDPIVTTTMRAGGGRNQNDSRLMVTDPGLLVTMKMLHREDPNANSPKTTRGGAATMTSGRTGNVQHQWFYASQQLVAKILAQCYTASAMSSAFGGTQSPAFGGMRSPALAPKTEGKEPVADPSLVDIHKDAHIVTRLDFKLPQGVQGPLGKLPMDSLEVHYIRIEEVNRPQNVFKHYKRAVKGQEHPLAGGNMGFWYDSIKEGTTKGSMRSVDVVITPGSPQAVNPGDKRSKPRKGMMPIIVQILTIETSNPTIEK